MQSVYNLNIQKSLCALASFLPENMWYEKFGSKVHILQSSIFLPSREEKIGQFVGHQLSIAKNQLVMHGA